MTKLEASIAAFIALNGVTVCAAGATTMSADWRAPAVEQTAQRDYAFAGTEHGLIFAEYLSDDEYVADVDQDLDRVSFVEWTEAKVLNGEDDVTWDECIGEEE